MPRLVVLLLTLLFVFAVGSSTIDAATKSKGRSSVSAAERKKVMDYAIKTCRKKYGPDARVFRIDYQYKRFYCISY